jgi:hypothetical protein
MESICFAPSLQQNLRENARVTVAIAVVSCLLIWFLTSLPRPLVIALGLGGGIALFAFYTGRFYVCAPRRVEYSDKTLTLEYHSGKITELVWSEVETASFTNEYWVTLEVSDCALENYLSGRRIYGHGMVPRLAAHL